MLFSPKTTGAVVKWFIILTISAVLLAVASQAHCQTPADSLTSAPTSSPSTTVRFFPLYGQPIPNSVINVDSLREAVVEQQADSSVWITLTGYSDGIGVTARWTGREREVNAAGAQQRAQYVFDALVGLDADPQRISIRTAADSRQDMQGTYRRVEIGLRKMEPTVVTVSKTDTVVIVPPKPSLSGVAFNEDTIRVSAGVDVAVGQKYISCFWSDGDTTFGLTSGLQFTADRVFVNPKTGNLVAPQNADTFQVSVALASPFPTDGHVSKMTVVVLAPQTGSGSGGSADEDDGNPPAVTDANAFSVGAGAVYGSSSNGMFSITGKYHWGSDAVGVAINWNPRTLNDMSWQAETFYRKYLLDDGYLTANIFGGSRLDVNDFLSWENVWGLGLGLGFDVNLGSRLVLNPEYQYRRQVIFQRNEHDSGSDDNQGRVTLQVKL